jgi:hypothetical protein
MYSEIMPSPSLPRLRGPWSGHAGYTRTDGSDRGEEACRRGQKKVFNNAKSVKKQTQKVNYATQFAFLMGGCEARIQMTKQLKSQFTNLRTNEARWVHFF